ncbi:MAG: phage tail length tape measure family protein [Gemmatimonadales bacterium]|nr:phage tail length tape measure family protein [Gemmatimonadales bacterium]
MATDLEKLIVSLSADFKSYENAMAKASGITRKELAAIKAAAAGVGGAAAPAFAGASAGAKRFGADARAASRHVNDLLGQTGNLAAQFNDIGVQLAGGQSPFLIALQQGTQISQVLGGQGARGAVVALGGAFASLLNPVSLVTIGLIAAGGAAVQYFSGLLGDSDKSAEELQKQADLIKRVAAEWGAAVPAIQAYADERERLAKIADLEAAGASIIGDKWSGATEQVETLRIGIADVVATLQTMDAIAVLEVQHAFNALADAVDEHRATGADAERVQAALNASVFDGIPMVADLAAEFAAIVPVLDATAASAGAVAANIDVQTAAMGRAAVALREYTASREAARQIEEGHAQELRNLENARNAATEDSRVRGPTLTHADMVALGRLPGPAPARAGGGGGGGGGGRAAGASAADREREAVAKLIEALTFEQSLIGATDLEREKANALRRAGTGATAEQRAQIEQLVTAMYAETEAMRANEARLDSIRALSKDVLGGIFEDMRDGANASDILANALNRVAESLVKVGIEGLTAGIGGGGFGGFISALTGGGRRGGMSPGPIGSGVYHTGGIVGLPPATRMVDPAVFSGARRMHAGGVVGLNPGEVPIIAQRGEQVIPRGGAGGTVNLTVDVRGATGNQEVQRMVASGVASGMAQVRREVPGIVTNARRRGAA